MLGKYGRIAAVASAAMLAAGCLQKETTHTLYLSPDGEVAWFATDDNVRSDSDDRFDRSVEEREFAAAAAAGRHPVALALEALGPSGQVRTTILRDEPPFVVVTDARFQSVETVLRRLFEAAPCVVSANLTAEAGRSTLTVDLDFDADTPEPDTPVSAILENLAGLRIVLTEGRFVSATGFEIVDGHARLSADWLKRADAAADAGAPVQLVLIWDAPPV